MITLFVAAPLFLAQPPAIADAPPESLVTRERVMANLEALPKGRAARGDIASQKGLVATEELLVARLKEMGYAPVLEDLQWNLVREGESEKRLQRELDEAQQDRERAEKGKDSPAKDEPAPLKPRSAPETTPELASRTWHNIVIEIPRAALPKEVLVVSSHFDAVPGAPGADDDGSGVAVLLEAARVLKDRPMKRTVRMVFFNLEELGLLGSIEHVRHSKPRWTAGEEKVIGMVSLEMLGYFSDEPNSQKSPIPRIEGVFEPPTVGDFLGVLSIQKYSEFAQAWARGMAAGAPTLKVIVADKFPFAPPDFRRSDHAPFWAAGVPALMLTDTSNFRNPHYHKATDTIETLDPQRLTLAAKAVVGAIRAVADAAPSSPSEPRGPATGPDSTPAPLPKWP